MTAALTLICFTLVANKKVYYVVQSSKIGNRTGQKTFPQFGMLTTFFEKLFTMLIGNGSAMDTCGKLFCKSIKQCIDGQWFSNVIVQQNPEGLVKNSLQGFLPGFLIQFT